MTTLDDKAKYEKATGQKLPEKMPADCEICDKETLYVFAHVQPGYGFVEDIPMYNCTGGCEGTRSYRTLMKDFNGRDSK